MYAGEMNSNAQKFVETAFAQSPVIAQLAPEDADVLAKAGRVKNFARRTTLDVAAGSAQDLYLMMQGQAEYTSVSEDGEQFTLVAFGAGSWVNWLGVLEPERIERQLEVTAKSILIAFPGELVRSIIVRNPKCYAPLYRDLARRFRVLMDWVEKTAFTRGARRVANLLIVLAKMSGDDRPPYSVRISQEQIARLCGCSRQTLNELLQELQKLGVVETGYRKVVIRDLTALERFVRS